MLEAYILGLPKDERELFIKQTVSTFLLTAVAAVTLCGQAADTYVAPRTEWGQPDLQGVWNFSSNVPMQRPQQFGEREFMTDEQEATTIFE